MGLVSLTWVYPILLLLDYLAIQSIYCLPRGGTWVFRGAHPLVIKIKKYP